MRSIVMLTCLILAAAALVMPAIAPATSDAITGAPPSGDHNIAPAPALLPVVLPSADSENPTREVTTTPVRTRETESLPPTRTPIPPTPARTSLPPTPVRTVQSPTPATPVPAVTVTVLIYPSRDVYQPFYYYPPYYPYAVNSYYPTGSLTIRSNPSDAIVILDGYNSGTTPYMFTGLATGYHTVEIDYPGYEAYVTDVYIDNGANPEIDARLIPLVSHGSLFIDSTPRGADVYVDGNYQGTSPVTVSALSSGPHQVEIRLAGYEALTSTQNVFAGQGTVVSLALTPYSPSSAYGSVGITASPPGGLVYLDGLYKGSIQSGNTFTVSSVSPGSHTVFLHLPGYTDITQTVQVSAGRVSNVNAVFTSVTNQTSAAGSPAPGSLVVTSEPAGSQVTVDNQFRGVTPVTIYNLDQGTHIVNLHLNGYKDWSTSVTVPANQVVEVPATLAPGSDPAATTTRAGLSPAGTLCALALCLVAAAARLRQE